jgi:hypothetical protein
MGITRRNLHLYARLVNCPTLASPRLEGKPNYRCLPPLFDVDLIPSDRQAVITASLKV